MLEGNKSTSYGSTSAYRPYGTKSRSTLSLSPLDVERHRRERNLRAQQRAAQSAARFQNYSIPGSGNQTGTQNGQNAFQNAATNSNFGNFGGANFTGTQNTIPAGRQVYKGRSDLISPTKPKRVFNSPY